MRNTSYPSFFSILAAGLLVVLGLNLSSPAAAQQQTRFSGCQYKSYQSVARAENELGSLYVEGAQVVSFNVDNTSMPYKAFLCMK